MNYLRRAKDLVISQRHEGEDVFGWFTDCQVALDEMSEMGLPTMETRKALNELWERFNYLYEKVNTLPRKPCFWLYHLGEIATKIRNVALRYDEMYSNISDEIDAFGAPSECYSLATKGMDDEMEMEYKEIFETYHTNAFDFDREMKKRVSGKWLYDNRL